MTYTMLSLLFLSLEAEHDLHLLSPLFLSQEAEEATSDDREGQGQANRHLPVRRHHISAGGREARCVSLPFLS